MHLLRQNTAVTKRLGPFLDESDGKTPETSLSFAQADLSISKAGGAFASTSDASPTVTHDSQGFYSIPFTATDTDTLGDFVFKSNKSGCLPYWDDRFTVVPAAVYDALVAGTGSLTTIAGSLGAQAKLDVNAECDTAISDASLASLLTAIKAVTDNIPNSGSLTTLSGLVTAIKAVTDNLPNSGSLSSLATASAVATLATYVDTEVAAIKAVTDLLPDDGALTSILTDLGDIQTAIDALDIPDFTALTASVSAIKAVTDLIPDAGAMTSLITALSDLQTAVDALDTGSDITALTALVNAIKAVTDNLPNSGALSSLAQASTLSTVASNAVAIKAVTDTLTATLASISGAQLSASQVNAQMVDVLSTDLYNLPGQEKPSITPTLAYAILQLYKMATSKQSSDGSTVRIYGTDATTVDQRRTINTVGSTTTVGEVAVGP